jgi:hypothetical protein
MKKSTTIIIWLVINIVGLSLYGYMHYECLRDESVMRGRGSEAREITKKEDPEYYEKRMKGMWTGYILIPLLTAALLITGIEMQTGTMTAKSLKRAGLTRPLDADWG